MKRPKTIRPLTDIVDGLTELRPPEMNKIPFATGRHSQRQPGSSTTPVAPPSTISTMP